MQFSMKKNERKRDKATKRWSIADTNLLFRGIRESVHEFEKPTAKIFYQSLIQRQPLLEAYEWTGMRDKMRNLKTKYKSAVEWRNSTGAGLTGEDSEKTIRGYSLRPLAYSLADYILKLCPDFDTLEEIFGSRASMNPTFIFDSGRPLTGSHSDQASALSFEGPSALGDGEVASKEQDSLLIDGEPRKTRKLERSSHSLISQLCAMNHERLQFLRKKMDEDKEREERKMVLEREKLELERTKVELEIRKMEEDSRLRELEIQNQFLIEKLRLEKELELIKALMNN